MTAARIAEVAGASVLGFTVGVVAFGSPTLVYVAAIGVAVALAVWILRGYQRSVDAGFTDAEVAMSSLPGDIGALAFEEHAPGEVRR